MGVLIRLKTGARTTGGRRAKTTALCMSRWETLNPAMRVWFGGLSEAILRQRSTHAASRKRLPAAELMSLQIACSLPRWSLVLSHTCSRALLYLCSTAVSLHESAAPQSFQWCLYSAGLTGAGDRGRGGDG